MRNPAEIPIAIIGMACRLPGADNLDEYWEMLCEGRSGLGELPPDRFDPELHYHPDKGVRTKSYTRLGGVTTDRPFDRAACPIPQHLIDESHKVHLEMCQVAAAACENAGLNPFGGMSDRNVGVYVGHTPPSALAGNVIYARQIEETVQHLREVADFDELARGQQADILRAIVSRVRSQFPPGCKDITMRAAAYHAAGIVSKGFGLTGPSMSFDAACASSLRALGHGVRALQLGEIDTAIIGGASYCHADTLVLFSHAQSVSRSGSRPFDEDADGLVVAEGYVSVVLKTLQQALADNDPIQAVIRGVGVSSDGKGKSLWAPRYEGQIEAMRRAYTGNVSPRDLQYIEMHATSTQVGDATEMKALTEMLAGQIPAGRKIPIGSAKSNVGHTLESAGLTSLVKTVLAIKQQVIPQQINVRQLNTEIDWENIPFFVPQTSLAWNSPDSGAPRLAAVNAFGIGGLNVHVVLEEHLPQASRALVTSPGVADNTNDRISSSESNEPIAIVGMGAIFPGARTIGALWDMFRSGVDQKRDVPADRWNPEVGYKAGSQELWRVPSKKGGFITDFEYDWKKHRVPPKQIATADPLQFMLLDAADQAFEDAGYHDKPFDKTRTGVIVGTIFGGEFTEQLQSGLHLNDFGRTFTEVMRSRGIADEHIAHLYEQYVDILLKHRPALIDETGSFTASTLASRITKTFDLMGGATAVDSGDTSAFSALSACIDLLHVGDCDMMICAAGQRHMGLACYEEMARTGLLAQGEPRGPFSAAANGCVPGEGVGVVILKRLRDAQRDENKIHAIIRGIGASCGSNLKESVQRAMARGLESAGIGSEKISVIEAASSGVRNLDQQEIEAVAGTYGTARRKASLLVGAVAGQIGNTAGVSGMASLMKAVEELNHVEMPQNAGTSDPASEVLQSADTLRLADRPSVISSCDADGRLFAGVNSYSQCDLAYHLVVEGATRVPTVTIPATASTPSAESAKADGASSFEPFKIVRIGGGSLSQLAENAAGIASNPVETFQQSGSTKYRPIDRCRLAIVVRDADELAACCQLVTKHLQRPEARTLLAEKGVFVGEIKDRPARVLFAFPGQGSQYTGMLKQLVAEYRPAAEALREVDEILAELQFPSFAELAWQDNDRLGSDVWRTQLSLLAADTIMYAAVHAMGMRPDRVTGHSFGELVALVAAGSWSFEDALRATRARCAAIDACAGTNGVMLSTSAPLSHVEKYCCEIGGQIHVSHSNAPDQTVAGGVETAITQLSQRLAADGFQIRMLDVPAAFHTPLMEAVKAPFGRGLAELPLSPPTVPLLSSVTNCYVADPADIRENLVVQLTRPVNYLQLVERVLSEGFSVLVEVGPKQVLTGLHKRILGERRAALISCDHKKRAGLHQLVAVRAYLEANGVMDTRLESPAVRIASSDRSVTDADSAAVVVQDNGDAESAKQSPPAAAPIERHEGLNVIRLSGTPYEMGFQHGSTLNAEIKTILRRHADLAGSKWDALCNIDAAVAQPENFFAEAELEELRGIAAGAGVAMAGVIALNLRLFGDAGSGGLHFALTAEANPAGGLLHAANEELQRGLSIRDCLHRYIQVRQPADGIAHVTFDVAGQLGGLNGINARGVAVSSAALLDVPRPESPATGVLQTVLVKNILEAAQDIDSALDVIRRSRKGTAAWSLCLTHHDSDRLCYVEYDGTALHVQNQPPAVVAANHRLIGGMAGQAPRHSAIRLERLKALLGGDSPQDISITSAQTVLRDRFDMLRNRESASSTQNTLRRVDNQVSIVMQPGQGALWVTAGPTANGHQNDFTMLRLDELLPIKPAASPTDDAGSTAIEVEPAGDARPGTCISQEQLERSYSADTQSGAHGNGQNVCSRFVMRVIERPLQDSAAAAPRWDGSALILGHNSAARSLRERLESQGVTVTELPVSDDVEDVLSSVDRICEAGPPRHLFVMTACDDDAATSLSTEAWQARRRSSVMLPYLVCQRWFQHVSEAGQIDGASIVAATRMGGDFGFSGQMHNVDGGALVGLIKGIDLELKISNRQSKLTAKLVDSDGSTSPSALVSCILRELADGNEEVEVGYCAGRRYVVRPVPEPVSNLPRREMRQTGPIVVTGGARGVTAVVARELGVRMGAKLHLIGSSPVPEIPEEFRQPSADQIKELRSQVMKEALARGEKPIEAWSRFEKAIEIDQTLQSFAEAGVQATYHACDVGDRRAVSQLLDSIRAQDGPIQGIVHGAGFERASRFEKKQPELVDRTIRAKIDGAALLMDLTREDPIAYFLAFGSVSGRFGGVGQTDYCLANEMLAKLVDWYRQQRPECRSTLFHWHAWDDVGMAVRPESQHIRKLHNIKFMPSREGAEHLIDELEAGLPEGEIVITELAYCKDRYAASEPTAAPATIKPAASTKIDASNRPTMDQAAAINIDSLPLIDAVTEHKAGRELTAEVHLDPAGDVFLLQHCFKGRPMMPVVASMEAMAQAGQLLAGADRQVVGLRDLELLNGLRFHTDGQHTARILACLQGNEIATEFTCDFHNRRGQLLQKDKPYLRGVIELAAGGSRWAEPVLQHPSESQRWHNCRYPDEEIIIYHGPVFRCLKQIAVEGDRAWGRLSAPALSDLGGNRRGDGWIFPPAILDSCFFACGVFLWFRFTGVVAIPSRIDRVRLGRQTRAGEQCIVQLDFLGKEDDQGIFNFAMFGEDGTNVLQLEGYRNVIVNEVPAHAV